MTEPDFRTLFAVPECDDPQNCEEHGWQLTPRIAALLHSAATICGDQAREDVDQHGNDPVKSADEHGWWLFTEYPPITFHQSREWREKAAKAFDDLAEDLAAGQWPLPRTPAEEMALHLIIDEALDQDHRELMQTYEWFRALPATSWDDDLEMARGVLFQDDDIRDLFDAQIDGIEHPESEENRFINMGDYRPANWFTPFANATPRG